mgnify:CR=1 FL=1
MKQKLQHLQTKLKGELFYDDLMKAIYATDASVYRMLPLAVACPQDKEDIKELIYFAKSNKTSLIPRTAGTSLAGQCVGEGIVVDVSKHFTEILNFDEKAQTITVQPGVVRDALNIFLKPYGLFFGPNTSTSNRCMIGGMVGNNSSGTTSIQYGVTRDKVLQMHTILSDGSEVVFGDLTADEFYSKTKENTLEGTIYKKIYEQLSPEQVQKTINANFPKPEIHRRNTGYAIDEIIKSEVFNEDSQLPLNICQLLTGSEGTLAFTTEITLKLDKLPPKESIMVAIHFKSIENCLKSVEPLMMHSLFNCEMMDKTILDCTKRNKTQQENRSFIVGDPTAILMCEVRAETQEEVNALAEKLIGTIEKLDLAYAYPKLMGRDINKANDLRSAGLGLLGNIVGDEKSAACIEDTAVALADLADYISEFTGIMKTFNQEAIYYAHAGAGELHLRPILNLKKEEGIDLFRKITTDVAHLVKKYKGSMSGEHGDGIVRSEFIEFMIGADNYNILKEIKSAFDPDNIFNPGKIVDPLPMDKGLRYKTNRKEPEIETFLDFSQSQGILREAEKCNGSGDCRKLKEFGGVMCPSYRATKNEKDTTRARANALREFLTIPIAIGTEKANRFNHEELKDVFDLCLSCKACSSECPSSVDVAALKAEFQYQYQKENGVAFRSKLFASNNKWNAYASKLPKLANFVFSNKLTSRVIKNSAGIAEERSLPLISSNSFNKEYQIFIKQLLKNIFIKKVYLFNDEFTNYLDSEIGVDTITLLTALNYQVEVIENEESGRSYISKGLLEEAKELANKNVELFKDKISEKTPLIGIEPSAILTFKDEYLKLADDKTSAGKIARHTFLIEEFIQQEIENGNINANQFTKKAKVIKFHGHCYQKALSNQLSSFSLLNLPENYKVSIIPSGCCGMAGSFGYEKEHYEISMQIGEQTLFPAVRNSSDDTIIAANGTSCRHQIKDGTNRLAKHPISILKEALV